MNIITPPFRASYPNVFKARRNDMNGKDEYSVVALFAKNADLTAMKKAAQDAVVKKWGADKTKGPKNLKSPFRDQGEREKGGKLPAGYEVGAVFINLKSAQRPQVVDQNVQPIIDETEFYAGVFAKASVNAFAYDNKGNAGVSFGLGNIQKIKDGDSLGGRTKATDDFQALENTEDGGAVGAGSADGIFK